MDGLLWSERWLQAVSVLRGRVAQIYTFNFVCITQNSMCVLAKSLTVSIESIEITRTHRLTWRHLHR
jgi:hypothetical protein